MQDMPYRKKDPDLRQHCLQCGDPMEYGRADRKFCSQACRNRWNNTRRFPSRESAERKVLLLLQNNYAILRRLVIMGVRSIDFKTLRQLGFQEGYVTCFRKVGHRNLFGCFDICYEQTPSRVKKLSFTEEGVETDDGMS